MNKLKSCWIRTYGKKAHVSRGPDLGTVNGLSCIVKIVLQKYLGIDHIANQEHIALAEQKHPLLMYCACLSAPSVLISGEANLAKAMETVCFLRNEIGDQRTEYGMTLVNIYRALKNALFTKRGMLLYWESHRNRVENEQGLLNDMVKIQFIPFGIHSGRH